VPAHVPAHSTRETDNPYLEYGEPPQPLKSLPELEEALGYEFKDKELLKNALVHKSYLHQAPDFYLGSNERLEFLGDSVLGLIVSTDLFVSRPELSEGRLTALRGALVRKNTLAELAAPLMLGDYLFLSRGEEAAGGRTRDSNLARLVEAILGAVYLDGGLEAAEAAWNRILVERSDERMLAVLSGDYKSQLQQLAQAHARLTPAYRLVKTSGPEHAKEFHVEVLVGERTLGSGAGRSKQLAEQAAAEAALTYLREEVAAMEAALDEDDPPGLESGEQDTGAESHETEASEDA
jgi:ribonuclease-3